jgi:predicted negative regulator of RcsB-dependent stress response
MEIYSTEEERLEALQRWWKENKTSIFYGLLLGLALIAGWRMWQSNKQETAQQASLAYHQLTEALQAKQNDSALKQAERLIQQYPSTTYAEFARLFMARLKVEAGDLDAARKILEEELSHSKDEPLKHIVRLRLARVMLAKGDVEPALKLLDSVPAASIGKFEAQYAELRGDLLAAAKRPSEARAAYAKAKELGDSSPMLELKLNDLPAAP